MRINKHLMQGFTSPLLDSGRTPARLQSFKTRQKRQEHRKQIGQYDEARVVHAYGQQAFSDRRVNDSSDKTRVERAHYKQKHKHKRDYSTQPNSFDMVQPKSRREASAPVAKPADNAPYRFSEPKSRLHP